MSEQTPKTNFLLGFFVGMAILSTVAFFTLLIVVFNQPAQANLAVNPTIDTTQPAAEPTYVPVVGVKENEPFKGGKDAKVTIIEYTDFECPYCLKHHDTIKQIISTYGNKIKYVLRNFPLGFHPEAQKAAESFECALEQGKSFEMSDAMFQANEAGNMSVDKWKSLAKGFGLNTTEFNDCLDTGKYADKVAADAAEGGASGVTGTPATFVNGQLVSGALPFENFQQTIDALLK
ncbi:MAG: hypothetical protein UT32_C0004G0020 [Parcubacteria group bacterium GW2011_GWC2_39_14]|nr:MAG: hypothetical protein UT32_C0004G0020 [Parcubacteria group bacterium GW2011_GWC2_39_14]KKR54864.1 MAG: hypothetical protein UT91_C0008G0020 [Parcubacteria group bacterium GW2011_GWA2_40_23]